MMNDMEPRESKTIGYCHVCGGEIYDGERYAELPNGKMIHCADELDADCLNEAWSKISASEKAEMLGYEVVT